jgi:hypothetical protein
MLDEPYAGPPCDMPSGKCGTDGMQLAGRATSVTFLRDCPMASTMYARMAIQIPYEVMYGIGDKTPSTAITAIMSEAMNHSFDGA